MNSPKEIQERRRDELLRRQLGPQLLAAIADPAITDIIVNEDGRVWFEAHGKGLFAADFCLPKSHRKASSAPWPPHSARSPTLSIRSSRASFRSNESGSRD